MPKFTHTVETSYSPSFRTEAVAGMFDVPVEERLRKSWDIDLPIDDEEWEVGIIVGASGAGKTTIARKVFENASYFDGKENLAWDNSRSLLDSFKEGLSVKEITGALAQVGFSSPPVWMLPFDKLSNGQKFRAEMARIILETEGDIVIDEFTSVVDRNVAKVCANATQKLARRYKRRLIAVSCHDDIVEWLEPDWVYRVDTNQFTRGRLRRPKIEIFLQRVHHSAWRIFKGHHYLSKDCHKAAHCYLATWNGEPTAFVAALKFPHHTAKDIWRSHRTVVLPDYQGIGIGGAVNDTVGQHYLDQGLRFTGSASHPAMNAHRARSKKWRMIREPGRTTRNNAKGKIGTIATNRITLSFEYIGDKDAV